MLSFMGTLSQLSTSSQPEALKRENIENANLGSIHSVRPKVASEEENIDSFVV